MAQPYEVTNSVRLRNIYGGAPGMTVAATAGASSMGGARAPMGMMTSRGGTAAPPPEAQMTEQGTTEVQKAAMIGVLGKPVTWWLFLFLLMLGLMWGAKKIGSEEHTFGNIQLSVYNILIISFASILGINFFKVLFTRFPVPGLTAVVNAV